MKSVEVHENPGATRGQIAMLVGLVLLGVIVRIAFHPQAIEPMHRVVANPAMEIVEGHFHPHSFGEFRYGLIYPAALSFALFGVSLASFSLYPLLCSIGSLILAYAIGKRIGGTRVGLGAVFVLSVLPLDIYIAGRGEWPDGPQAFFATLALWLLMVAVDKDKRRQTLWVGFGCGLALGMSCLVKVTTLYLVPALIVYAVVNRKSRWPLVAAVAGLGVVFVGETTLDYWLTGDLIARVRSITGVSAGLGDQGGTGYSVSQLSAYPKKFFLQPLMYGLHMYAAVGAVVYAIRKQWRQSLLLLLWVLWFFGYVWLGSSSPTSYRRLSQFARYIAIINVPLAVLIALWFASLRSWVRWGGYVLLAAAGLFMANLNVADQGERTIAVREAARYLNEQKDSHPVYVNLHTDSALRFFLGSNSNRRIVCYGRTSRLEEGSVLDISSIEGAYVLYDRNHVEELQRRYPDNAFPREVVSPPAHWKEVLVISNPGRASSYSQLRMIRAVAKLPIIPQRFSSKLIETIDKTLKERDLVLYFVP
ncbi:MAG: glycosyltransferase family 39 protein [Pirellulales bacterium]|nr:glycosyltransferase family 39 protein [Pirellulales bacterium]